MPLYNYICENCSYEFEELLPFSQRGKPTSEPCPDCAGKVRSKVSGASYHAEGRTYKDPEGNAFNIGKKYASHLGVKVNNFVPASDVITSSDKEAKKIKDFASRDDKKRIIKTHSGETINF